MSEPVQLSVRSELSKIIAELEQLREKAEEVSESMKDSGENVAKNVKNNTKKTENFFGKLRDLGRRAAEQLRGDFKSLASITALTESFRLTEQFRGAISETITLSDSIRKLGGTFGIAGKDFVSFQSKMTHGLGQLGMDSDVASRALEGLQTTRVRGEENIIGYTRQAGMLASIANERGREGDIAGGMARVIQARGGNVNDSQQMRELAEQLRRVFVETGKGPTETLKAMEDIFANMPKDLRESLGPQALTSLATASAVGGPSATKFLEEYLGKSPIARMAFEAQGGKGVFTEKGIDMAKFKTFSKAILARVGGDPRLAAQTLGLSEDAAEGFVRLAESIDRVSEAQNRVNKSTGDLVTQYRASMTMGEAFKANINKVKSVLATPLSWLTQKTTELLGETAKSDAGAAGVVLGGGVLAAMLAGGGLAGIGKSLFGTFGKGAAAEAITGQKTQPVYVVNTGEIGSSVGTVMGGSLGSFLGKAGLVGAAGAGGYAVGTVIEPHVTKFLQEHTMGTTSEGFKGDILDRFLYKLDQLTGGMVSGVDLDGQRKERQRIIIELNKRELRESKQPTRGSSVGP